MKILIITGSLYEQCSGPYLSLKELSKAFFELGHEVTVIGTKDHKTDGEPGDWGRINVIAVKKIGSRSWHYSWFLKRQLYAITNIDFVILHTPWLVMNATISKWCIINNIPYIVSIRGSFNKVALNVSKFKKCVAYQKKKKKVFHNTCCIHALTFEEYKAIRKFGLEQPVAIIPNGISMKKRRMDNRTQVDTSTQKSCRNVVYLGRLHPIKGIDRLLSAWSEMVPETEETWKLLIAGPDNDGHEETLKVLAKELEIEDYIRFLGPKYGNDKYQLLSCADFLVLPSLSEGMPMTVLEALSLGVPVLISESCNLNVIQKYGAGRVFKSGRDGLKEGLREMILLDEASRKNMGERGVEYIKLNHDWKKVAERFLDIYVWAQKKSRATSFIYST